MKKFLVLGAIILGTLLTAGCPPLETTTRNAIAAASGAIASAEVKYAVSCKHDPTQAVCQTINDGIKAVNTAIDAEELYCSGTPAPGAVAFANGGACVPVQNYAVALNEALLQLNQIAKDVKGL